MIPVREDRNMHGEGCYLSVFFFFDSLVSIDEASAAWFLLINCRFLAFFVVDISKPTRFARADTDAEVAAMIDFGELFISGIAELFPP